MLHNEALARTEDNEIHYRMRKAGFKLRFCPDIISYQHTRSSLPKMLKQKYANGYWIGKTSKVCPGCLSIYHFVPWAFVMAIIVTTVASVSCKLLAVKSFFAYCIRSYRTYVGSILSVGSSYVDCCSNRSKEGAQ